MPRRRRHGVGALLALTAAGVAGCQADLGTAGCQITSQTTLAGSPLTLLASARLDPIGAGYALIGTDGTAVRWAALGSDGTLGPEHAFGLPATVTKPIFAMAGTSSPGDTVLVGYLGTDTTGTKGELSMIAVPADGTAPGAPASTVHEFANGAPPVSSVAMMSSRKGMNAGLAWVDGPSGQVQFVTVNGAGALVGAPTPTAMAGPDFSCLGFGPGKNDLTVTYYSEMTPNGPGWVIAEGNESGGIDSQTMMSFPRPMGTCATVTPTTTGYAIAWQDGEGAWLGVYPGSGNVVLGPYPFASATAFGGATLQPALVALAPFGSDFGAVFQRARDAELWRFDAVGSRRSGALIFPSLEGNMGTVSAVARGGVLTATYADYTTASAVDGGSSPPGDRVLVNATCY